MIKEKAAIVGERIRQVRILAFNDNESEPLKLANLVGGRCTQCDRHHIHVSPPCRARSQDYRPLRLRIHAQGIPVCTASGSHPICSRLCSPLLTRLRYPTRVVEMNYSGRGFGIFWAVPGDDSD